MKKFLDYKFRRLLFLLIVYQVNLSNETPQIACSMSRSNRTCTVSGLALTLKNSSFVPVAPDSSIVTLFEISESVVPTITSDICTTFTKLNIFVAIQQDVEVIEDNAFYNCTEMTTIVLDKNNIRTLGEGVFSNMRQLHQLYLSGASLEQMNVNVLFSNLSELLLLQYSGSGLKELPVAAVKNLKKLKSLYVYSNDLSDLDVEGLVENLPNLKKIAINDNDFRCDRLIEIIDSFEMKNIEVTDFTPEEYFKKRDYNIHKIKYIICHTQPHLQCEKEFPIGKAFIEFKDIVTTGSVKADSNIIALSNTLNETSDIINKQMSNLTETLQHTTNVLGDAVNSLKENMPRESVAQETLKGKLNDTSVKLQQIADSVAIIMDNYKKIMDSLQPAGN